MALTPKRFDLDFEKFITKYFEGYVDLSRTSINGIEGTYNSQQTHDMWCAFTSGKNLIIVNDLP
jgi:hypothetical protein